MQKIKLKKSWLSFLLTTILHCNLFSQDSSHIQLSLLTCGPGLPNDELYTTFGHSGIRIKDSNSVTDLVYNYGTFDEFEENFYLKFIKGRLSYRIDVEPFSDFIYTYQTSNRTVIEQVLNLSAIEKIKIQQFLNNNLKPENRNYKYDFCFDNCTTRLRDIIKKYHDSSFAQTPVLPYGTTFRQAIYFCLNNSDKQWSKLGIDILLGMPCDAVMTSNQMEFLPNNLMKGLDNSSPKIILSQKKLFTSSVVINKKSIFNPFNFFVLLFTIIFVLSILQNKYATIFLQGFDGLLFFIVGLLGIILIFMWFATDHLMTKNNFNLLWAFPTHIIIAFFVSSKKKWVNIYFGVTGILYTILLLGWSLIPQHLNTALIPVILLLIFRCAFKYFVSNKMAFVNSKI